MKTHHLFYYLTGILLSLGCAPASFGQDSKNVRNLLEPYNVVWDVPGPTSAASMPVGNGDIGLNVWAEPNGDLVFFIGKTDAWSETNRGSEGLLKLGTVRVSLDRAPDTAKGNFLQTLKLYEGEIVVTEGSKGNETTFRVWVDANHPVIRVEAKSENPVSLKVGFESWRMNRRGSISGDTILNSKKDRVVWYHRNSDGDPQVKNLTFGGNISGEGFVTKDDITLQSASPAKTQLISITAFTATTETSEEWIGKLDSLVNEISHLDLEKTRKEHLAWWDQFWNRSWIFVQGEKQAREVTEGYVLQRFITACGGRGAYPIKFNGSIFVVNMVGLPDGKDKEGKEKPPKDVSADYRAWGGQYWFQNTRPMYWPRLAAGDFDMMLPLFRMYAAMLPANAAQVQEYYHHDGAYFAETAPFWGGLKYVGPEVPENWTDHYFTPILELSMMMLDYYEYTGDAAFAKETLLPVASAGVTFFDKHFQRDAKGKILFDPDNAIEMYWKVHNPAPDIGGLRAVLPRLIALPDTLVSAEQRKEWQRMLAEMPELPTMEKRGKKVLLPYTGEQTAKRRNGENPELYAIYPFRLYGMEKPDLIMARDTFLARTCTQKGCWVQDPIQAAYVGLADIARDYVTFALTRKEPMLKFPAFWAKGSDYMPDQDNGGNGEQGLQRMLMQTEGKKILLLPAWPKDWNADFKLNAPYQTTVQGRVENGKLSGLVVTPAARMADVIDMSLKPEIAVVEEKFLGNGNVENVLSSRYLMVALKQTQKGQGNVISGDEESGNQNAAKAIDGNPGSKYLNRSKNGGHSAGVDTGFVIVPEKGAGALTLFQLAAGDDMPNRDPYAITIEGSNAADADKAEAKDFVLLYEGVSGLEIDPGRKSWGKVIDFKNSTPYKSYRILVTETRNDADATQYGEVKLGQKLAP